MRDSMSGDVGCLSSAPRAGFLLGQERINELEQDSEGVTVFVVGQLGRTRRLAARKGQSPDDRGPDQVGPPCARSGQEPLPKAIEHPTCIAVPCMSYPSSHATTRNHVARPTYMPGRLANRARNCRSDNPASGRSPAPVSPSGNSEFGHTPALCTTMIKALGRHALARPRTTSPVTSLSSAAAAGPSCQRTCRNGLPRCTPRCLTTTPMSSERNCRKP